MTFKQTRLLIKQLKTAIDQCRSKGDYLKADRYKYRLHQLYKYLKANQNPPVDNSTIDHAERSNDNEVNSGFLHGEPAAGSSPE